MITKDYKPSMKAEATNGVIRCTPEYLKSLHITDESDQGFLETQLTGQAICPRLYFFEDSERARKLLKVTE